MNSNFRKATLLEIPEIWVILEQAIVRRKKDGSQQWQDGYPNPAVIKQDIEKGVGYVLTNNEELITGYAAILFNDEPAYEHLNGTWLTNNDFAVVHRLAISDLHLGKGYAKKMLCFTEDLALENNIFSIKVDTNFDNTAMLKIFEKLFVLFGKVN